MNEAGVSLLLNQLESALKRNGALSADNARLRALLERAGEFASLFAEVKYANLKQFLSFEQYEGLRALAKEIEETLK